MLVDSVGQMGSFRTEITRSSCNRAKSHVPRATERQCLNTEAEIQCCWRNCDSRSNSLFHDLAVRFDRIVEAVKHDDHPRPRP